MLLANVKQARDIDRLTINEYNIPSILLMENAGKSVCDVALKTNATKFVVVVGKGNNGGDGSVAARHLHCCGKIVSIVLLCQAKTLSGDAKAVYEYAVNVGINVVEGFNEKAKKLIKDSDVIIDAILGIGAKGQPKGVFMDAIEYINKLDKYVISVDVPSGANADNGNIEGCAIKAKETVTFGIGRLGLMLYPAKEYAGKVTVKSIGFAPKAIEKAKVNFATVEYVNQNNIPDDCHKGSVGKTLVVAGSQGMTGASYLASLSALKSGSGVVSLCIPYSLNNILEQKTTEIMTIPVADNGVTMTANAKDVILKNAEKYNCMVIGCGIGNNEEVTELVNQVVKYAKCPLVIDADGINCLEKENLKSLNNNVVITPHIGEMARLTGINAEYIKNNLLEVAINFAKEYKVAVVLKCATTVIAFPNGKGYVNTYGNKGMATAGSGDVLAGIIGSFIAQGEQFETAVINGVCVHSMAGDKASDKYGFRSMSATNIIECISDVLMEGNE